MGNFFDIYPYLIASLFMVVGLYAVMSQSNLIKKVIGLNIFQISVFLFYIIMGKIFGATAPILKTGEMKHVIPSDYSNPLPHVLILTAIVVGVATTSVAYALIIRIKETYGTIEEDEIYTVDIAQTQRNLARWAHARQRDKYKQRHAGGSH